MYKFSEKSQKQLDGCHPDLQNIFNAVIRIMDISILCGYRDKEDQQKAFKDGKSKLNFPKSKHNYNPSIAIDVAPYPIKWNDYKRFYYLAGIVKAISYDLYCRGVNNFQICWGGDWDNDLDFEDQNFNDLVHFELIDGYTK